MYLLKYSFIVDPRGKFTSSEEFETMLQSYFSSHQMKMTEVITSEYSEDQKPDKKIFVISPEESTPEPEKSKKFYLKSPMGK